MKKHLATIIGICLAMSAVSRVAGATTYLCWNTSNSQYSGTHYDNGYSPAVATNDVGAGEWIGQHLGADGNAELWYNPGSYSTGFESGHYTGYPNYQVGNPSGGSSTTAGV